MKKIVCFLLTLCLCAGLCVPVFPALAADGDIRPYTVSGDFDGVPFSVTFSAAKARKATVTQIFDDVAEEYPIETRQVSVTVLTLCVGSVIKINQGLRFGDEGADYSDEEPYVLAMSGQKESDGFHMFGSEATFIHSGLAERLSWGYHDEEGGETYQYGHFINTAGWEDTGELYLLELGDTPAPPSADGYQAYAVPDYDYDIVFEAAKVETRPVTLRYATPRRMLDGGDGTEYGEYEAITATVVKAKPGSVSWVSWNFADSYGGDVYLRPVEIDEQGRYTVHTVRSSGRMYWVQSDFLNGAVDRYLSLDSCYMTYDASGNKTEPEHIIQLDDACPFTDVRLSDYYAHPVLWAVNGGITNGTTATTFSPHDPCTRAQILTFIWRYSGEPEPTISNPFRDVSAGNYYYKAALWAYQKGMASSAAFEGSAPCTRAAAVTYLWILAGRPEAEYETKSFSDVPANSPYAKAVAYAVDAGITEGTSDTAFSPERVCSRAHIVTFLERYAIHQYYR